MHTWNMKLCHLHKIVHMYILGGKLIQTINVRNSRIIDASIRDPYILLRMSNKSIMILRGDMNTKQLSSMQIPSYISVNIYIFFFRFYSGEMKKV